MRAVSGHGIIAARCHRPPPNRPRRARGLPARSSPPASPITYLGAAGLVLVPRKHRLFGWSAIVVFCAAVYVNACVEDWWAGASYGPRRFDGVIPLLVVGLAATCDALRGLIEKRPMAAVAALLVALVAWNVTYMAVALTNGFGLSAPRSFGDVSARQATALHRWVGHPFSLSLIHI